MPEEREEAEGTGLSQLQKGPAVRGENREIVCTLCSNTSEG